MALQAEHYTIEVYCDESYPELFTTQLPKVKYVVIGSLWLESKDRDRLKKTIHALRDKHKVGPEFKWRSVTNSRLEFYQELMNLFFSEGERLRFRCIAVDHEKVDHTTYHAGDKELGFYKFYYQLLHPWIRDFNEYSIFCDFKRNRLTNRLNTLQEYLQKANLISWIRRVQPIESKQSVLIQIADVITGATAAKLNNQLIQGSAKSRLVEQIESRISGPIQPTYRSERKFNVFEIDLKGW